MNTPNRFFSAALAVAAFAAVRSAQADPTPPAGTSAAASKAAHATEPKEIPVSVRMAVLREGVRDLDARMKTVRARVEKTNPRQRGDSPRILAMVEQQHAALAQRLAILQASESGADETVCREMETAYEGADKLLARVERWYQPRR
ncbi:hypothetical protein LVJ94_42035 [Pendulispora rubella]|uniref:Uncharacterized protein n=1 Tax=Pendulispora rubella TaxID=2741070 RepID=A0ABZ2KXR4_9BACT